ncbi:MAG: molybdopterin cofactor-binding domain-containing protein, partial [Pseudomonadales bacterium]
MPDLPAPMRMNPALDRWITINRDDTITVRSGKSELGQGIKTALTLIAADELDVDPSRIRIETADTRSSPNEFITAGSMSVETSGAAVRQACAQARRILISKAADALGIDVARLSVEDGQITGPGANRSVTYSELMGGEEFGIEVQEMVDEKPAHLYRYVGRGMKRVDLPGKVRGDASFVHDLERPGMLHGRMLRGPGLNYALQSIDEEAIRALSGIAELVRDGDFVAVLAEREEDAARVQERAQAHLEWRRTRELPGQPLHDYLKASQTHALLIVDGAPADEPVPEDDLPADAERVLRATYTRPYHMHASLGPSAAMALYDDGRLMLWSQSQGVEILRLAVAQALRMPAENIDAVHVEGAGCYGHNGADDVAMDAALAATSVPGRPVLMKWSRRDEHLFEPYAPAMRLELAAALDRDGLISHWSHDVWSFTHGGRPRPGGEAVGLIAAWQMAQPHPRPEPQPARGPHVGIHRNADPLYAFPQRRVVKRFVKDSPLRTSSTRGLGAYGNVFAIESFMDEMAHLANADPVEFRLAHLQDERAKAVIRRVMKAAGARGEVSHPWQLGRGLAFAQYKNRQTYAAILVELAVNAQSAETKLLRTWIAADAGCVIDPDGLANQLEGGFIQAASWTLKEAVTFGADGVTSVDWESYPILRFDE